MASARRDDRDRPRGPWIEPGEEHVPHAVQRHWEVPTLDRDPSVRAVAVLMAAARAALSACADGALTIARIVETLGRIEAARNGGSSGPQLLFASSPPKEPDSPDGVVDWLFDFLQWTVSAVARIGTPAGGEVVTYDFSTMGHSTDPLALAIGQELRPLRGNVTAAVHGSIADATSTAFSDFDDLVIVHPQAWESRLALRSTVSALRVTACAMQIRDPLQHHGHWIYTDFELDWLDEGLLPLVVLDDAKVMHGQGKIEFSRRSELGTTCAVLWSQVQRLRRSGRRALLGEIDAYELKHLVSSISLVPALLEQAHGAGSCSKRQGLTELASVPLDGVAAIEWASSVRRSWSDVIDSDWVEVSRGQIAASSMGRSALERATAERAPIANLTGDLSVSAGLGAAIRSLANEGGRAVARGFRTT